MLNRRGSPVDIKNRGAPDALWAWSPAPGANDGRTAFATVHPSLARIDGLLGRHGRVRHPQGPRHRKSSRFLRWRREVRGGMARTSTAQTIDSNCVVTIEHLHGSAPGTQPWTRVGVATRATDRGAAYRANRCALTVHWTFLRFGNDYPSSMKINPSSEPTLTNRWTHPADPRLSVRQRRLTGLSAAGTPKPAAGCRLPGEWDHFRAGFAMSMGPPVCH
jgi:hypothetical protein